jgi:hypothetical protein
MKNRRDYVGGPPRYGGQGIKKRDIEKSHEIMGTAKPIPEALPGRPEGRHMPATPRHSHLLQNWWHTVLREHDKYFCFAILLVLPADEDAIRYATDFGKELDSISGKDCLVLVLTDTHVQHSGLDERLGGWR